MHSTSTRHGGSVRPGDGDLNAAETGQLDRAMATSGRVAAATRSACSPLPAVPTTSKPASARSRATPSRHIGWSSTTSTRTTKQTRPLAAACPQLDLGSAPRRRRDVHQPTERFDPSPDRLRYAETPAGRCLREPSWREPLAVVAHADHHGVGFNPDQHPRPRLRPGMSGHVVQGSRDRVHQLVR